MRRLRILRAQIRCHQVLLRVAARDGDARWVSHHLARIHELTVRQQAAEMRQEKRA